MIRKILGLGALLALLQPVSCLSDDGPNRFTTTDQCAAGDVEGCDCVSKKNVVTGTGLRACGEGDVFSTSECRCKTGCTIAPDCASCGDDCVELCVCNLGRRSECQATCAVDSGTPPPARTGNQTPR